jgi:alpha-1,2-mannosyltransferase
MPPRMDMPNSAGTAAQRWFIVGLLVLFAAVSVQYTVKVLTPRNGETTRSAIVRWRDQLLQLDSGENIYERFTYPNPPVMAIMLRPIAELPPLAGALLWYYLKVGLALASFAMAFRLAADQGVPFPPWAKALTVLLSLRPVLGDLMHGNVNLLILFLVIAGLMLFRRGRDVPAGIVIALAIACKVTPALFIPYFVWKRAWRVLAGVAVGLVLFLLVVPAAFVGWADNLDLLQSWVRQMVVPYLVGGVVTSEHPNQSLPGLVHRLLTSSPSFTDFQGDRYVPVAYHNVADIGPAAKWVVKALMGVFALAVVWACRTPTADRRRSRLGMEYAIVLLGMLLFSERTWKHHAVTLVLPFAVLSYQLAAGGLNSGRRFALGATLAGIAGLMLATSTAPWPDSWAKLAQVYGAYTAAFGVCAVALIALLRSTPNPIAVAGALHRAA